MTLPDAQKELFQEGCPFCEIARGEGSARMVLNGDGVVAFFPLEPAVVGHVLVVPKAHIENVWSIDLTTAHLLAEASLRVAKALREALEPEGLNLIQSNGEAASQTVAHLHIHVVPRWRGDPINEFWPSQSPWSDGQLEQAQKQITQHL